jgi:hypothetical protein
VREVAAALIRVAKERGIATVLVGHVTKDGAIAGPRLLEHLVDVVLAFEGDRHSGFRMVRSTKNRYGPADEVGCFEMTEQGIVEVPDPSGLFVTHADEPVSGTAVTVTMEGRRPLLAEVQALTVQVGENVPVRRITHGVDGSRVAMLLAVLQRRAGVKLAANDVYVSTVGGARCTTRRRPRHRHGGGVGHLAAQFPSGSSLSARSGWPVICGGSWPRATRGRGGPARLHPGDRPAARCGAVAHAARRHHGGARAHPGPGAGRHRSAPVASRRLVTEPAPGVDAQGYEARARPSGGVVADGWRGTRIGPEPHRRKP